MIVDICIGFAELNLPTYVLFLWIIDQLPHRSSSESIQESQVDRKRQQIDSENSKKSCTI